MSADAGHRDSAAELNVDDLLRSVEEPGVGFRVATSLLLMIILAIWVLFGRQLLYGLGVTGLNQPVAWGELLVLDALAAKMVAVGQAAWTFTSTFVGHFINQVDWP